MRERAACRSGTGARSLPSDSERGADRTNICGVAERSRPHKWTKMSKQVLEGRAMASEGQGAVAPRVKTAMHD
jgi:hypothetical protein